jgi:ferredoxin
VSAELKTGHVMVKDEDVCLHCGLCAERCPTGAWDMQKFAEYDAGRERLPRCQNKCNTTSRSRKSA